jgi:tetratricopeptide (TPR) repeat protein
MEYIAGPTLRERIEEGGPLPPREAGEICAQIASGLAAAHAVGLIHRDIKPSNILLERTSGRAKIMDFGLARAVDGAGLTLAGELLGTPAYMSPEQIRAPDAIDVRSDVYSLGATLYEALTGVEPFRGTTHGMLQQVLHDEPPRPRLLNETIPVDLETICLHALAKEPARRYASALAMGDDLRRWLNGESILARPDGPGMRFWRWIRRNPRVAALSGAVAVLLVVVSIGSLLFAKRLATEKHETEAALGQAESNAVEARAAEADALANAEEARSLGAAALEAHSALVFQVQEQLGNKAGTLPLRKQLLETALAGLEKIVKRPHTPNTERSVVAAYDRMSDVLAALGRSRQALESCTTACALAQQRAERLPNDIEAQRELAQTHDKLGVMRYVDHNLEGALQHYEKARDIRMHLVEKAPTPELTRDLVVSLNKLADVYYFSNQVPKAEQHYLDALRRTESLAAAQPDSATYQRDLRFVCARLVTLYEGQRDLEQAGAFQTRAARIAQALAKRDPANLQWQRDDGFTAAQAGTLDLKLDKLDPALSHFRTYLEVSQKLHVADPENVQWSRDVGLARQHLAEVQMRLHKPDGARALMEQARQVFEELLIKDPTNVPLRVDLVISDLRMADWLERRGQYREAAQEANRGLEVLQQLSKEGKLQGPILVGLKDQLEGAHLALREAMQSPGFASHPLLSDASPWLVALWALAQARAGKHASAAEAADRLNGLMSESPAYAATAGRVYALCAQALSSEPDSAAKAEDAALRDKYREKSIHALSEALRLAPWYEWHLEPDFDSIRSSEGYRKFFNKKNSLQ